MSGINKYDPKLIRKKASSPRLMVHNSALMTAMYGRKRRVLLKNPDYRGHLIESAVGAYLINRAICDGFDIYWWREGNDKVDFVISDHEDVTAIEVKSGRVKSTKGMTEFLIKYPKAKCVIIGVGDVSVEKFLSGEIELF